MADGSRCTRTLALALGGAVVCSASAAGEPAPDRQRVSREELVEAMQAQQGFDITATTNGGRFQGGVILRLARQALERDSNGPPLFIDHEDSFEAYLQVARLPAAEAPVFVRKAFEHRQDQFIEYRQGEVLKEVERPENLEVAVSVRAWWPDTDELPKSFFYVDTYSTPNLRVTNRRVITYKLVEFSDFLLYDEVSGVSGRPTTGLLSLLFKILGEGRVTESRSAISADGLQIVRAHARKGPFSVKTTVTIQPDGKAEKGVDPARRDLLEIEERLRQDIRIRYR